MQLDHLKVVDAQAGLLEHLAAGLLGHVEADEGGGRAGGEGAGQVGDDGLPDDLDRLVRQAVCVDKTPRWRAPQRRSHRRWGSTAAG